MAFLVIRACSIRVFSQLAATAADCTTTQSALLQLGVGSYAIDTPGIREFGLAGLTRHELIAFYPELAAAAAGCRFSDCQHEREPGCAVTAAVAAGAASAVRYDNYLKIRCTLAE